MRKIAIIVCDAVAPPLAAEFGEYADMIMAGLAPFSQAQYPALFEYHCFDAVMQQLPSDVDAFDGFIITGSTHDAYADKPWIEQLAAWILKVEACKVPLVGICFGHQIIARALGGEVAKSDKGWGLGVSINRIEQHKPWMTPKLDTLQLLVSHQDQVLRRPDSLELVAASDFCPNYMLSKGEHIFTVQGHPEFSLEFERKLIERKRKRLNEVQYDHALTSLELPPHSSIVMGWIAQFLAR